MRSPHEVDIQNELRLAKRLSQDSTLEIFDQELDWMMEEATGFSRVQRMLLRDDALAPNWKQVFNGFLARRLRGEPTQYILGKAAFFGRDFLVTPDVLIPRPETEELVEWVIQCAKRLDGPLILDVGTGSGCIATTLALELPSSRVTAIDVSKKALAVATESADRLGAQVSFVQADILTNPIPVGPFDIIVSNPPYVPDTEKNEMQKEVVDHEPHLALFPGPDPLLFYRRLAEIGPQLLPNGGWMAMEMHTVHARNAGSFFSQRPFSELSVHSDMAGLDRFGTVRVDPS